RRRRREAIRLHLHHFGTEGAHVEPDGGRAGPAIEKKPDRPLGFIGGAVLGIVGVEQMPLGYAAGGVADGYESHAGRVLDGLIVQRNLMLCRDWLCRVADRLHLIQAVVEAIEAVGVADSAASPAL